MLGHAEDLEPAQSALRAADDALPLMGFNGAIKGRLLPIGARPTLAPDLNTAEHDLGNRLLSRPSSARWWTLSLQDTALEPPVGRVHKISPPPGALAPVLIDSLGKPVVAAWVPSDGSLRWYVVPYGTDWNALIDWVVQHAIPHYVPDAPRRFRSSGYVDPAWQTSGEREARERLEAMVNRHVEERTRLQAELENAQQAATVVRDGLLFGTGDELVRAVEQVLSDAGLSATDLDASGKGTWSADLVVSDQGRTFLLEVKSAGRTAGEHLVGDLLRHLNTWATEYPDKPVSGGTLIVNQQVRKDPSDRSRQIYTRPEFVNSLDVQVISTIDLFDWWRQSNWPAIRKAVLGVAPSPPNEAATQNTRTHTSAATPRRGRWFWSRHRENGTH